MKQRTIRSEFVLFAACLSLPLIGLIGYGLHDRTRAEFAAAESVARRVAESSADRVANYVSGLRSTLEALARRPLVKAMDAARCDPHLADLVDLYPQAASFSVINLQGVIICSSRPLPRDRVMRILDEELLREMLAQPRFLIHKPVVSRLSARWVMGAVHPIFGQDGALRGMVAVAIDLLDWHPFPPPEGLPEGATVTIVTSDGTIIARSVDAEKWISRKVWDERLMQRISAGTESVVRAQGADGANGVFGVKAVAGLPWFVLAGLPEEGIYTQARERLLQTGALLALVVGAVSALAWGFVASLSKPMRAIADAVQARAEKRGDARIPVAGPIEVAHVARELNRMIESGERDTRALAKQAERLKIVHDIDRAIIAEVKPEAIAAAVLQPLRGLLGVPRAIVNMIDTASGEVEWLAAAGRRRMRIGPGVRHSSRLMGDVEALRRGKHQRIEVRALPPGPEVDALLASGVHFYMAVPMIAGGELIGALSFGGEQDAFPPEQIEIAQEVATQLAIAIAHARLFESVRRHAEELELRVRERTAQLETVNKELESFSYSVSHDLRAPLRAVDGYALMLEEDYGAKLDEEGRRLLGVVRREAARMGQLIDDLLAFSRTGRQALQTAPIDMEALAREAVGEAARDFPAATIEVGSLPRADGDRGLLKQVWLNLVGNALKYSAKQQAARVKIEGQANGEANEYWVRDNGAGFDPRYAGKLFGVFQRLHGVDQFAGTGVGLAIVQRVVARHGGRVWAEGAPDKGAMFGFSLPRTGDNA